MISPTYFAINAAIKSGIEWVRSSLASDECAVKAIEIPIKKPFCSDNYSGAHPRVIEAISRINTGHQKSYGCDETTIRAQAEFKKLFGEDVAVFFVPTGTAANLLCIQACCKSFEGVICSSEAHIQTDECGAAERAVGVKLLLVPPNSLGKLDVSLIKEKCPDGIENNVHTTQPRLISISQCTESGTVYSVSEIKNICEFAHSRNMLVHMDGARISNAAASLNCTFKEFTKDAGVDILSFGGTKNGLLMGEAVVVLNPAKIGKEVEFFRKQNGFLISKMRFISAQFLAFFEDDLWLQMASHSNQQASKLESRLRNLDYLEIAYPVQANELFVRMPREFIKELSKIPYFYIWNDSSNLVRLVTSFDTLEEDLDSFVERIKQIRKRSFNK